MQNWALKTQVEQLRCVTGHTTPVYLDAVPLFDFLREKSFRIKDF